MSGTHGSTIAEARTPEDLAAARELVRNYALTLEGNVCLDGFAAEMAAFPGEYSPPGGAVLLARHRGLAVGVVCLRPLEARHCELKRLYLTDAGRGVGLGRGLIEAAIARARALGYRVIRLDTLPGQHERAIALYRRLGFAQIPPYPAVPIPGALHFELTLMK